MDYIKKNMFSLALGAFVVIFIIGFFAMVFAGAVRIDESRGEVMSSCIKTEFIVLGGRHGTPRPVYDCRDVELESLKR